MFKSRHFNLGKVVFTYAVNDAVAESDQFAKDVISAMQKFCNKDWGNASQDSKNQNEENLSYPEDLYLFATYKTCKGEIWIITNRATENPGENLTTVLFPDEY